MTKYMGCGECNELFELAPVVPDEGQKLKYCPSCGGSTVVVLDEVPTVRVLGRDYFIECPDGAVWGPYGSARVTRKRVWIWLRSNYGQEELWKKVIQVDFRKG